MKLITKGFWYYEMQILMFVFMWQHNMNHKAQYTNGICIGRFHVWYDTQWTQHGIAGKLRWFWINITWNTKSKDKWWEKALVIWVNADYELSERASRTRLGRFFSSLRAYFNLHKAGFRISYSGSNKQGSDIYRFWWGQQVINDMPDIDCVDGHWNTVRKGHTEILTREIDYNRMLEGMRKEEKHNQKLVNNLTSSWKYKYTKKQ